jgi:hypothetical protein
MLRRIFGPKVEENCIVRNSIICTLRIVRMAQDKSQYMAVVKTVMNLQVI